MLNLLIPKLHREGYRFVAISAVVTFIFLLINNYLGVLGLIFTIWVYYFFRDPDRFSIKNENYLLSQADGKITQIVEINGPKELGLEEKKYTRISIFMDVFSSFSFYSEVSIAFLDFGVLERERLAVFFAGVFEDESCFSSTFSLF